MQMIPSRDHIIDGLNEAQRRVVTFAGGPLLVIAGPGTGKTLTIVRRIAWLLHQGVAPERILAVTFTNRAAREMKERAAALLGRDEKKVFIGTFHFLGLEIIRNSRGKDFVLYGREEQIGLLKSLMHCSARKAQDEAEKISRIKNFQDNGEGQYEEMSSILEVYQAALQRQNAYDFDDLISIPIDLLENNTGVMPYHERFRYIIVDEYQDINPAQYRLLRLLSCNTTDVLAVGDSDQAIYGFRGADLDTFLNFEKDFHGASRIVLSENYRSTGSILHAADSLIRNNRKRFDKELMPKNNEGLRLQVVSVPDERSEGAAIIQEIETRIGGTSHYQLARKRTAKDDSNSMSRFSDFAVLYRTNAQGKILEEAFSASGIPYQMIGRRTSAQARVSEEMTAYLRSLVSSSDRGMGPQTATQESKLLTPADLFDPRADAVALMTMHMAKGLEFPVVFITGCEEGLLPCTIIQEDVDVEEERRLLYVGMTRARDELFLIHARTRFLYGQQRTPGPSLFLAEVPEAYRENRSIADKCVKRKPEQKQMGLFR